MENNTAPNEELIKLVKDGYFFNFCVLFAINKGFKNAIKEKKEVEFTVGDYNVKFNHSEMIFELVHKTYFARIIVAHYHGVDFVGDSEEEVISELLTELEKELSTPTPTNPLIK